MERSRGFVGAGGSVGPRPIPTHADRVACVVPRNVRVELAPLLLEPGVGDVVPFELVVGASRGAVAQRALSIFPRAPAVPTGSVDRLLFVLHLFLGDLLLLLLSLLSALLDVVGVHRGRLVLRRDGLLASGLLQRVVDVLVEV